MTITRTARGTARGTAASNGALADLLDDAGLGGRGGAGFSTARKLRLASTHRAELVVNVCDGELGAHKDAWVVSRHLDELLEGAALVLTATGGRRVRWAAHRGGWAEQELRRAGQDVLAVPRHYVSSEESALVSLAHGGLARPMTTTTPVTAGSTDATGRRLPPTLVLNAETVWRVAQISRHGAAWFRSLGTVEDPGPRLVTVTGDVEHPGVLETRAGEPLAGLLSAAGARDVDRSLVLVGGLAGALLPAGAARTAVWSTAGLAPWGARLGSGVVEVLDPARCPLGRLVELLGHAAQETAGQCGPCMFGVPTLATEVRALVARPDPVLLDRVRGRLALLRGRGACHYPDGVAALTVSALDVLGPHLEQHANGRCEVAGRPDHG